MPVVLHVFQSPTQYVLLMSATWWELPTSCPGSSAITRPLRAPRLVGRNCTGRGHAASHGDDAYALPRGHHRGATGTGTPPSHATGAGPRDVATAAPGSTDAVDGTTPSDPDDVVPAPADAGAAALDAAALDGAASDAALLDAALLDPAALDRAALDVAPPDVGELVDGRGEVAVPVAVGDAAQAASTPTTPASSRATGAR